MSDVAVSRISVPDPPRGPADSAADWRRPFRRLDSVLAGAVAAARERFGAEAGNDSFRGLYVTAEHAVAALREPVGEPLSTDGVAGWFRPLEPSWTDIAANHGGWAWLRDSVGLTDRELDAVLIALGPEADLRYERLYGYLQDDVSRRRPTVNLVLDLLSTSAQEKLAHRAIFAADGRLIGQRLMALADDNRTSPPLLARIVVLDGQVADLLLSQTGLDRELAAVHCHLDTWSAGSWARVPISATLRETVLDIALAASDAHPLRIHVTGPDADDRRAAAEALAGELALPLLQFRVADMPAEDAQAATILVRVFREAALRGAVLFVDGVDDVPFEARARTQLVECLAERGGITLLGGATPWMATGAPLGVFDVALGHIELSTRQAAWSEYLDHAGVTALPGLVNTLADRFSFGPAQIAEAVSSAVASAGRTRTPTSGQVFSAARRQTSHRIASLARRVEPACTWADIVLPADTTAQLKQLCARVRLRTTVLHEWGFDQKLTRGRGTCALFTGPPGTGKTTAAEVVAGELGLDLFAIDLSSVVSKYIGETEKNMERIFAAAAEADAILMFDEADALFSKRSEVHDAHDRYANIETSYLLQRMEQYEGIAILATNLRQNLDEAFIRRLQFVLDFPFPDEASREGIWRVSFPPDAPAADLDLAGVARDFRLSGAGIMNAALHAAFLAAAESRSIETMDLYEAARREFQKMGRTPPDSAVAQER